MAERSHRNGAPERCCIGDPWTWAQAHAYSAEEPLDTAVIEVAAARGIDPHDLHEHVEWEHGWESHDVGYRQAVEDAVDCVKRGKCDD